MANDMFVGDVWIPTTKKSVLPEAELTISQAAALCEAIAAMGKLPGPTDSEVFTQITGQESKLSGDAHSEDQHYGTQDARHKKALADHEKLPLITDACQSLIDTVQAENRQDIEIHPKEFRIDDRGRLAGENISLGFHDQAWRGLVARAPDSVSTPQRSNINSWIGNLQKPIIARTGGPINDRMIGAIVSDRYTAIDADKMAEIIRDTVPANCRGKIRYQGDMGRYEIQAQLARPFDADGDAHAIQLCYRGADNGTASHEFRFKLIRLECLNGLYLTDSAQIAKVRHVGDPEKIAETFQYALDSATEAMHTFAKRWGIARAEQFVCAETGEELTGPAALQRLAGSQLIQIPHVRRNQTYNRLMTAWGKEPGDSVADVINAATRMAHEQNGHWKSPWYQEGLEEQAGQLLFSGATRLLPLNEEQIALLATK